MKLRLFAMACAALLMGATPSFAQQTPPPYGAPIPLDVAKKIKSPKVLKDLLKKHNAKLERKFSDAWFDN